ncbi:hypothetical protein [Streptomyces sp. SP17KL33]|uniref:hypothetical protein n=1 Tax=Streptomyces sp. SP17KL33 TaxID=3002534 RepID=UPI002E75A3FF|nr:hypothetical protein [Streptomyces sp. SP17KL33]MEE1834908.1 hypothetical protein [Streptomyces sp. SP17KL33]
MPRPYRLSDEGRETLRANAAEARKHAHNLDSYVSRVVNRASELTPAQLDRLRAVLGGGRDAA